MAAKSHRRRHLCRLNVEILEDRALLSTFMVDRLTDTGEGSGLAGDLRYCITQATSGKDTINFNVTGTINLSNPLPVLTNSVTITGPGADLVSVRRDTGGFYRIFTVSPGATVDISGLTLVNGVAPPSIGLGGGIYNDGTLTISNCTLSGNSAADGGAGIYNSSSGNVTLNSCILSSNGAANDGGAVSNSGTLTMSNSVLAGNKAIDNGGGIVSFAGPVTISDSTFSDNSASDAFGSALCVFGGSLSLSNSTVSGNKTTSGAGVLYIRSATATLSNDTLSANSSGSGGSIINSGTLTVASCTISGNMATGIQAAGAISNNGNLSLGNCTISGNTANGPQAAGGVSNSGTLVVSNSTINGNTANGIPMPPGAAGGIANSGSLTVSSSTISGNTGSGPQAAGGVVNWAGTSNATIMLLNSTLAGNTVNGNDRTASQLFGSHIGAGTGKATTKLRNTLLAGDGSRPNCLADLGASVVSEGHNLSNDDGSGFLTAPGDLVNTNPLLGALQDNGGPTLTMPLLPGSPAINAGDDTNAPAADQRGIDRKQNGAVDIGAFESRGFALTVADGDNQQTPVNTPFPATLQIAVGSAFGEPVQGGLITFTASGGSATAVFPEASTATVDSTGRASVTVAANAAAGTYAVTASANGASSAHFSLTNLPAVFLVTNNLDSGPGSFRQAILDVDATSGSDVIRFAIGTGMQTINLASPLPAITQPVLIDGTSQPGYSGVPLIELNGADAGPTADGLLITAGNSVVRGLVINRFSLNGIELQNNGSNVLQGNYLGTDITGTQALGNGTGLWIATSNNTVGGTDPGSGNLIAGNRGDGIFVGNGTANVLQGNCIGTNAGGSVGLGNALNGVHLVNASGTTIGGSADGASNVIAYNGNDGVLVDAGLGNAIQHNAIFSHTNGFGIELTNGGNNGLSFPVLASATSDGSTMTITGLLLSTPDTVFLLELFANSVSNPSGFGEGEQPVGTCTLTTNSHGAASFTLTLPVAVGLGEFIAATATDPNNDTSAFSNCVDVTHPAAPSSQAPPSLPLPVGMRLTPIGSVGGNCTITNRDPRASLVLAGSRHVLDRRVIEVLFAKRNPTAARFVDPGPIEFAYSVGHDADRD